MNKVIFLLLFSSLALLSPAQAQTPEPVSYAEQVVVEGAGRAALYERALYWTKHKFSYTPTSVQITEPSTGVIRLTGTSTLKPVDARGQNQSLQVLFTFRFQATDNGYNYQIDSFEVMPDPKAPSQRIPLAQYVTQIGANRDNQKTHNDRRIKAQATSLASEAAMSFRSFMNSQPAEDNIGVAGEQQPAQQPAQ